MHLGKHVAEMFAVDALLASALHPSVLGLDEGGPFEAFSDSFAPGCLKNVQIWKHAGFLARCVHVIGDKHLARVRPEFVDAFLHFAVAFFCAIAQANDSLGGMLPMVLEFLHGFCRDAGDFSIHQLPGQEGIPFEGKSAEKQLTHDGVAKVTIGLL